MNATSRGRFFLCPTSSGVSGIRSSLRRRLIISIALIQLLSPVLQMPGQAPTLSDRENASVRVADVKHPGRRDRGGRNCAETSRGPNVIALATEHRAEATG